MYATVVCSCQKKVFVDVLDGEHFSHNVVSHFDFFLVNVVASNLGGGLPRQTPPLHIFSIIFPRSS